jgi:hypothetical protein
LAHVKLSPLLRLLSAISLLPGLMSCGAPDRGGRGDDEAAAEGAEGAGGGPISIAFGPETYCRSVAEAACKLATKCDNETLFEDRNGDDLDACRAALSAECQARILPFERGVAASAIIYSAAELSACLDFIHEAECTEAAGGWGLLSCERGGARVCDRWYFRTALNEHCAGVFEGMVPPQGSCYGDVECGSGTYCNLARCRDERPGTCERFLPRGEQCAFTPLGCADGFICSGTSNIKKCKPLAVEGEDCSLDDPAGGGVSKPNCTPPFQCISGTGGQQGGGGGGSFGTCQPLSAQLGACGQGRAKCEPDSFCDFKSTGSIQGDCQPFKAEKELCKDDADPRQCGAGTYCFTTETVAGVVPPRVSPDGRCEKYQGLEGLCVKNHANCLEGWCTADAHSVQGFCEPDKSDGLDCSASYQCGAASHCIQDSATGTRVCAPIGAEDTYVCIRPAS